MGANAVAARASCCTRYHRAVELVGKRWTGAIVFVLLEGPARFSQIRELVPDLSDRLLAERLRELEAEQIVERDAGGYRLTDKGRELEPAVAALKAWAHSWIQ